MLCAARGEGFPGRLRPGTVRGDSSVAHRSSPADGGRKRAAHAASGHSSRPPGWHRIDVRRPAVLLPAGHDRKVPWDRRPPRLASRLGPLFRPSRLRAARLAALGAQGDAPLPGAWARGRSRLPAAGVDGLQLHGPALADADRDDLHHVRRAARRRRGRRAAAGRVDRATSMGGGLRRLRRRPHRRAAGDGPPSGHAAVRRVDGLLRALRDRHAPALPYGPGVHDAALLRHRGGHRDHAPPCRSSGSCRPRRRPCS